MVALGLVGLIGSYGYGAPPLHYEYKALGVPMIFLLMGPLTLLTGVVPA